MTKKRLSTYFLFVAVITLVTVFVFVVQKSYENLIGPVKKAEASNLVKPINPNLDIETLDLVEKKEEFPMLVITQAATPSASITPSL